MYNLNELTKAKQKIYDNFIKKFNSNNDNPFVSLANEKMLATAFILELNILLRDLDLSNKPYEIFHEEIKNENGRCDVQYSNTIIEFKKYALLRKKNISKEQNQAKKYLEDKKFKGFFMNSFLFDGTHLYYYFKDEYDEIKEGENNGLLTPSNMDFFIKTIFQTSHKRLNPFNIKDDFAIVDKNDVLIDNESSIMLLRVLFSNICDFNSLNQRSKLLFKEWEKMFHLAENDNAKHQDIKDRRTVFAKIFGKEIVKENEYHALFALHTGLSIIIKCLLARMINDYKKLPSFALYAKNDDVLATKTFMSALESGSFFYKMGISNLTDNDFFAWYVKEEWDWELNKALQGIIYKISSYENIFITASSRMLDMFKELYQNFIPKCVRHSFGEYYTPYYLAEKAFLSASKNEKTCFKSKRFLDPNCGSGTFLSVFFNYKFKNFQGERVDFADFIQNIVGIDINPIAVLMARANILIHGFKFCHFKIHKKYEIPVYLADSLYTPSFINIGETKCLKYSLSTTSLQDEFGIDKINIVLPEKLIIKENFFEIINLLEKKIIKKNNKKVLKIFEENSLEIKENKSLKKEIVNTIDELIKFEEKGLNSIWLKIFSNYFKVGLLKKFDYIVGNPPWVQWSVLPQNYRNNVKENISLDGLFSSDKNVGGNNLNICALIANKTFSKWLKDNGHFSFIMPKSILFNKSFEGFRNLLSSTGEQFALEEVIDFSKAGEVFEGVGLDFCIYTIVKKAKTQTVPMIEYLKKPNTSSLHSSSTWLETKAKLYSTLKILLELNTKFSNNYLVASDLKRAKELLALNGTNDYRFRKGVSVKYPMRLIFIKQIDEKLALFHPYTKVQKRLRVDKTCQIKLELEYIKPFITAPMLNETLKWENDYCICPYQEGTKKPLSLNSLKKVAPFIYSYLESVSDILDTGSTYNKRVQNFDENYGILRMGTYVWADFFVAIRDNTKLAPNLIKAIKTHWSKEKLPLFDNHISYISQGENDDYISCDEARYIYNILTNEDVNEIITNSQDLRSISSRLPIKIPYYKSN